jgi:hypothetical protein
VKNQKSCSFIAAQTLASVHVLFFVLEFLIIASSPTAQGQHLVPEPRFLLGV